MPHRSRPPHVGAYPVHITLRAASAIRCLRAPRVFPAVRVALSAASHAKFRIVEFSTQADHIHLIAEAVDTRALAQGVRGLAIRLARAVNRILGRRGQVWADRYHTRELTTPRAVRHALVYVLMNSRKHGHATSPVDPCSSAPCFAGWRGPTASTTIPRPIPVARTWLASIGWRRHGLIAISERPRGSP